jgi:hypothetical protein
MRQPATGITQNLGNRNRKKDRTAVRFSSVLWIFSVHRTEPANTNQRPVWNYDPGTPLVKALHKAVYDIIWVETHAGATDATVQTEGDGPFSAGGSITRFALLTKLYCSTRV